MPASSAETTSARLERAEDARRKRAGIAVANPVFFGETYLRPYDEKWDGPLPTVARQMLGFAMSVSRGAIITPPEFLKTTTLSQLYPLWLTFRYAVIGRLSHLTGMLLSEEQGLAERNLSVVTWHIENNAKLRRDFVDRAGEPLVEPSPTEDKWTDDEIVVARPTPSKDPTWSAKGINSQIQGARLQHLIGDDVVTPRSAHSPAVQRKAKLLWDTQVTTRVLEEGQAIIVGNFNHERDLLSEMSQRSSYAVMRRPSMHVPGDPETAPTNPRSRDIELNLPEKWPRYRLLRELGEKPARFAPIHLLRSTGEGVGALRPEWVTRIGHDDIPRFHRSYLLGIDPAPGSETDPDPSFFSITVACLTEKHFDVVRSIARRLEPTEQVDLVADLVRQYSELGHVAGIAVAKIALDRYFRAAVLVGHPELRPLLHEVSIHERDAVAKERLAYLGGYFKSGWARVIDSAWTEQTADPDDREQEESLSEQWGTFPNQHHDDRLDSLDVAIRDAREIRGGQVTVVSPQGETAPDDDILSRDL